MIDEAKAKELETILVDSSCANVEDIRKWVDAWRTLCEAQNVVYPSAPREFSGEEPSAVHYIWMGFWRCETLLEEIDKR